MTFRALTLADLLEEVTRRGLDPESVHVYAQGQPLLASMEDWSMVWRDGGPIVDFGYEIESCDCIECPDLSAHVVSTDA